MRFELSMKILVPRYRVDDESDVVVAEKGLQKRATVLSQRPRQKGRMPPHCSTHRQHLAGAQRVAIHGDEY